MVLTHNDVPSKNYLHKLYHYSLRAIYMFVNMLLHVSF